MKTNYFKQTLLVLLFATALFNSCSKKKDEVAPSSDNSGVTPSQTSVSTYKIVTLTSKETLASSYNGTFGNVPVTLTKTSDSTLAFIVPEVATGEQVLKFDLSTIRFTVSQTISADAEQTIAEIIQTFDSNIGALDPETPAEYGDIDSMTLAKMQITNYMNALSDDEKKQAVLFYEANKELFTPFISSVQALPSGSIEFRSQSDCPRTNYKEYYLCHASILLGLTSELSTSFQAASSVFGTETNAFVGGMYLILTRVRPSIFKFRGMAGSFLEAKWILSDKLFQDIPFQFTDEEYKNLNLNAKFRTIDTYEDQYLSGTTSELFLSLAFLNLYWSQFKFLGEFPAYKNLSIPATLVTGDITISNITNPRVELWGQSGESVRFRSINGTEESFQYTIQIEKQGFSYSKVLSAQLRALDSLAFYRNEIVGTWIHTWASGEMDEYLLEPGGSGYRVSTTNAQGEKTIIEPYDWYNTVSWSVGGTNNDFSFGFSYDNRNIGFGGKITYPAMQITSSYGPIKKQ
ncbi:MAG: hypothetical protein K0R51_2647 [Cytophagaceae bacterium]|jgi:hypothetical protein|nr:hypothetical protein [Cytophagaceae bacterium]